MENFKIYRDGDYSLNDNIKMKLKNTVEKVIHEIDHQFTKPL